jgi:hypothetical protein
MMRFQINRRVTAMALTFWLLAGFAPARADYAGGMGGGTPAPDHMMRGDGACKADMEKFCAGVKPGHGAIRDCLKQHAADLSPACKDHIAKVKEHAKEMRQELKAACKADLDQFCKDITPGEGREFACLHAHNDKLSQGCKDGIQSMRHRGPATAGTPPTPPAK